MKNKSIQGVDSNLVNHEMFHSMRSYSVDRVSPEEYNRLVCGKPVYGRPIYEKHSRKDKVSIIHPPQIESPVESQIKSVVYQPQPPMVDLAHEKKPSKLVQKVRNLFNNPEFIENAQKVLYVGNGLGLIASTLLAVNGYDTGNKDFFKLGITGSLISAIGLYSTYKFAQASSDICTPLFNFNTEIKQNK